MGTRTWGHEEHERDLCRWGRARRDLLSKSCKRIRFGCQPAECDVRTALGLRHDPDHYPVALQVAEGTIEAQ
jgi:hypothetical protein